MDEAQSIYSVYLALIVAIPAILSPIIMSWLTHRHRRQERADDYARQDFLAQRAVSISQTLRVATAQATATAARQEGRLEDIHTLVNGQMTATLSEKLALTRRTFVALQEIVDLKRQLGIASTVEARNEITIARAQIVELEQALAARGVSEPQVEETNEG